jgi:hypothetical protein
VCVCVCHLVCVCVCVFVCVFVCVSSKKESFYCTAVLLHSFEHSISEPQSHLSHVHQTGVYIRSLDVISKNLIGPRLVLPRNQCVSREYLYHPPNPCQPSYKVCQDVESYSVSVILHPKLESDSKVSEHVVLPEPESYVTTGGSEYAKARSGLVIFTRYPKLPTIPR